MAYVIAALVRAALSDRWLRRLAGSELDERSSIEQDVGHTEQIQELVESLERQEVRVEELADLIDDVFLWVDDLDDRLRGAGTDIEHPSSASYDREGGGER